MKGLLIGVHSTASTAQKTVDAIIAAEKAGIQCSWLTVGGVAPDPFAIFGAAAQHTRTIKFGTSIVPTFPAIRSPWPRARSRSIRSPPAGCASALAPATNPRSKAPGASRSSAHSSTCANT
ncbi:MAG: LLM class flavin-dependent oxidoreductase [Dehalococcoidia bacterium]|nr:LLM class flavin-dependent oxidoreductase [Dehalococcoidia bacterium]